jgi:integrase
MSEQPKTQKALPDDPFMVVREARAALKARREDLAQQVEGRGGKAYAPPALASVVQYEQAARRMMSTEDPWAAAANTTKRLTWLARKSALLFVAGSRVEQILKDQDKLQRIADKSPEVMQQWADQIVQLHKWTEVLANKPEGDPLPKIERRQSKRVGLSKLPDDWREQLAKRLPNWRMPYLVAACTGARPAEIGRGIVLKVEGEDLVATIQGAKTGPYSGQKVRELRWSIEKGMPELVRQLAKEVHQAGGRLVVDYSSRGNPNPEKAFSGAIRQAAARAFPGQKVTLTPYSLRHAAASDLKASGLTSQQQSAAMGHQVVETKGGYGHHSLASGRSLAPKKVRATSPVRGVTTKAPASKRGPSKSPKQA